MKKFYLLLLGAALSLTTMATPVEGALSGLFTINENGDQVRFSQGNLQYQASTLTWQFATNQYDTVGTFDNNQITETNTNCWMDLFGWGTGNHPKEWTINDSKYDTFVDWGTNDISNAYSDGHLWRTMSLDEWNYVCFGRPKALDLFGLGTVNGVAGAIILPDGWELPDGATYTFVPSATRGLEYNAGGDNYKNDNADNFSHNTFDAEQWAAIEATGAVFFPAAGTRYGNTTIVVGQTASYQTTTTMPSQSTYVNGFEFGQKFVGKTGGNRYYGKSVRLVIPKEPEVGDTIEVDGLKYKITNLNWHTERVSVIKQDYADSSLVIPDSIEYYGIRFLTMIDVEAFSGNTNITSVDIGSSYIGPAAFENCSNLETITLREGVLDIRYRAFNNLPKVESIHIPASVNTIDGTYYMGISSPFSRNSFKTITIAEGNNRYKIGEDGALYSMDGKKLIAFPQQSPDKRVGVIPEGVEEIVPEAFYSCPMADTVVIPSTLIYCTGLSYNSGIKCLIINNPGSNTCYNVGREKSTLEEIILGPKCRYLGSNMFYGSSHVRKITILSDTVPVWQYQGPDFNGAFGGYGTNTETPFNKAKVYVRCGMGDSFRDTSTQSRKWGLFENIIDTLLYDVQAVSTTEGTVTIAQGASCNQVTATIDVPDGYTLVNWNNGSTEMTTTYDITSDTLIVANVKKNLEVNDEFRATTEEGVSVLYKILTKEPGNMTVQVGDYSTTLQAAIDKATNGSVTIPDSVVYYDEKYEVVQLDVHAFYECTQMTALHLPNTIHTMRGAAISDCFSLQEINIPTGLRVPGSSNYAYLTSLKSITIPSTLKYLGYSWFDGCSQLETINGWNPAQFERVGALGSNNPAKFFRLAQNVDTVDGFVYAGDILYRDTWPRSTSTSRTIKEGTRIVTGSAGAQSDCEHIEFPASVEAIGSGALGYEPNLKTCTIKALTPPLVYCSYDVTVEMDAAKLGWSNSSCTSTASTTPDLTTLPFFVPKAAITTYKADDKWNMLDLRPIEGWTVEFRDHNGNNIIEPQQVQQGCRPTIIPTNVEPYYTYDFMYVFANAWDTTVVNLGDTIYTARYTPQDLPIYKVYFHETQEDAEAQTTSVGFSKVQHGHAVSDEVIAAQIASIEPRECEQIKDWAGGDVTNVTSDQHVYPVWGDGLYNITFFDPIANAPIVVRENIECGEIVVAPEVPVHTGFRFKEWDNLTWQTTRRYTVDLTVNAIYEEETEGIEQITNGQSLTTHKVIRDGVLYIERNGRLYNAQGGLVE